MLTGCTALSNIGKVTSLGVGGDEVIQVCSSCLLKRISWSTIHENSGHMMFLMAVNYQLMWQRKPTILLKMQRTRHVLKY
jgi:hypothetical protein